jgi:ATP-dependent Clp protease adapter protein ClpS
MARNSLMLHTTAPRPVRWWARALAGIIVMCGVLAYGSVMYRFFRYPQRPDVFQAFQILASLWVLPLFAYVVFKGTVPDSWLGIGSAGRWAALGRIFGVVTPAAPVVLPPQTSLLGLPEFVPSEFREGLEILNDNDTPMEFVVSALSTHLGISHHDSVQAMLSIHERGGALLPMASQADAKRVAEAITAEAAQQRYPLVCRAVSVEDARA